jgi:serine/threonine-protein phosphatase 2A catalytic subunit
MLPSPAASAPPFPKNPTMSTLTDVADVDTWITTLSDCKQLPESDIERLCEKVSKGALVHRQI